MIAIFRNVISDLEIQVILDLAKEKVKIYTPIFKKFFILIFLAGAVEGSQ